MRDPDCIAQHMLAMLPADCSTDVLLNAAEAHLIICPVHGHE